MNMNHLGLFEGIGGFSLAAKWMGWTTVAWCEWNPFGQQVLKYHFPEAEGHGDITKTDFTKYANRIDILTGGFPCQPYSQAGKRKGKADERHLFPEMLRAIKEIQPGWVVGENVLGLINWSGGLVFHEVQADLEAAGYEVFPYVLPACSKDAPHRRDRIWFVAYSNSNANRLIRRKDGEAHSLQAINRQTVCARQSIGADTGHATNSNSIGRKRRQSSSAKGTQPVNQQSERCNKLLRPDWQEFPTQSAVYYGNDGIPDRLDTGTISASRWRAESIKAGGNAIVPQVAYEIFKAIEQYELQH